MHIRFLLVLLVALITTNLGYAATVYKYVDSNGNLVFTDEPVDGAEEMDVKPVATIPAIPVPKNDATSAAPKENFKYQNVSITTPAPEENFINNQGMVTVQIGLTPALRGQDTIQLYFNGIPQGPPQKASSFAFENLDRGTYTTKAAVFDNQGNIVGESDSVTFFIRRSSAPRPVPAR